MRRVHSQIDQLILDSKDRSRFGVVRLEKKKCWLVCDGLTGEMRTYRTKFDAEQAVCVVIKAAMN